MDDSKKKFVVNTDIGFKRSGSTVSTTTSSASPKSFNGGLDFARTPSATVISRQSSAPAAGRASPDGAARRAAHRSIGSLSDLRLDETASVNSSAAGSASGSAAVANAATAPAAGPNSPALGGSGGGGSEASPAPRRRARPASSTLMDLLLQSDRQALLEGKPDEDAEDIRSLWAQGKGQESASLLFLQEAAQEDERKKKQSLEEDERRREFEQKQEEARVKREQRMAEIRKRQEEEAQALKQAELKAQREAEAELARIEDLAKRQAAEALEARLQREVSGAVASTPSNGHHLSSSADDAVEKKDKHKHHKKDKRDSKHVKKHDNHEGTLVSESRKSRAVITQPFRNCSRVELDFSAALRGPIDHFMYSATLDAGLFALHAARAAVGSVVAVEFDRITSGVLYAQARCHGDLAAD